MLIEEHRMTGSGSSSALALPPAALGIPQSGTNEGSLWLKAAKGTNSLAASRDAGMLQNRLMQVMQTLMVPTADHDIMAPFSERQFPMVVDREHMIPWEAAQLHPHIVELENRLLAAFDADPIEDGFTHGAEDILRAALVATKPECILWWIRKISTDRCAPAFLSSVLRCLGRIQRPGEPRWRAEIVACSINHIDAEVRDAAVQLIEHWGDEQLIHILQRHEDPEPWIARYAHQVLKDLGE